MNNFLSPPEIAASTIEAGIKKTGTTVGKLIALALLAGAYIAFAAAASNMAAFNLLADQTKYGLGKCLAGAIFAGGLMLVILCGAELFTGNNLILMGVLNKKVKTSAMLKNWVVVYIGNFLGSVLIAYMLVHTGLLKSGGNLLGAVTIKIAVGKVGLTFIQAVLLGILCNWLVCLAVWMATAAKDVAGKMIAIFFPIWMFVTSGFEHSVANMFYVPAGIFAKSIPALSDAAMQAGVTQQQLAGLNWGSFLLHNLLPVTIGNIIGGGLFVGAFYYFIYVRNDRDKKTLEALKPIKFSGK